LRLASYILLGDPARLVPSINSYYEHVDTMVASYDQDGYSWAGADIGPEIRKCLRLLKKNDPDGKVVLRPGSFSCPGQHPRLADTTQRQTALDEASEVGEWVVPLDTDEIVPDANHLVSEVHSTAETDADGLEYSAS